jgi:spore photoproduct lyase
MEKEIKNKKFDYNRKFGSFRNKTLFEKLNPDLQKYIRELAFSFKFTFQEFRQVVEIARDLEMWQEQSLPHWWQEQSELLGIESSTHSKLIFFRELNKHIQELKNAEKSYQDFDKIQFRKKNTKKFVKTDAAENFYGMCPVASPKTICCNLRTIDAVENCSFGCSYCTIQTFYTNDIRINQNLKEKLKTINLENDRFYHFGTGQSSDSLAYGDRDGILSAHCNFAASNPNILMEFKTKSRNTAFFLENKIPLNIVCSWSLNPQIIISNEEHFTASLKERLEAARIIADKGIKVAFHFHPMIYYSGWEMEYADIAGKIINNFHTEEVLFISYGSVTLIKPVIQKIRDLGNPSKILQMNFVTDPHGKFTYPDELKIRMFTHLHQAFEPWHDQVFFYLCMEKESIWQQSLGYVYESNEIFEIDFGKNTMNKIFPAKMP